MFKSNKNLILIHCPISRFEEKLSGRERQNIIGYFQK
jgi:hypothetical protein